jgi:hypothetical protein
VRNVRDPSKYDFCTVQFIACKIKANLTLKTYAEVKCISSLRLRSLYPRSQNQRYPHCTGGSESAEQIVRAGLPGTEYRSSRPLPSHWTELLCFVNTRNWFQRFCFRALANLKMSCNRKVYLTRNYKPPNVQNKVRLWIPQRVLAYENKGTKNSEQNSTSLLYFEIPDTSWAGVSTSRTTQTSGMCSLFTSKH